MSRIASVFALPGRKALIAYVTVGYPSIEATLKIVPILASNGCDIIELGIPFSDPLADGVTIQKASYQALQQGVTPETCLEVAQRLRQQVDLPLTFMTYYNPVLAYGLEAFCLACSQAGVDGLIVPDLPPEEGEELQSAARGQMLDLIYLLAPSSTAERISQVAKKSSGFIYLVSLTGVTGPRENLPEGLEDFVHLVRQKASQPLCVGFGISTPEQAQRAARVADGIIVGSRLIQLMEEENALVQAGRFVASLRDALPHP
jgi:tryptophan synthase alpha chain